MKKWQSIYKILVLQLYMIYISYRFTGVDKQELSNLLDPIYNQLKELNFDIFCNYYNDEFYLKNNYTIRQIMNDCLSNLELAETVLCLVDTDKYSCGMLLEIGYALANHKNIIVCSR